MLLHVYRLGWRREGVWVLQTELAGVFVSKEPLDKNVHGVVSLCKSGRERLGSLPKGEGFSDGRTA